MVYTIVVHLQAKPVRTVDSEADDWFSDSMQEAVEEVKAKLIEAAAVYRQDKEVRRVKPRWS